MTDYTISPVYEIVKFAWARLQAGGVLDADDYFAETFGTNIIPFVPVQEQPEMNLPFGDRAFIVYDYLATPRNDTDYWIKAGQVVFYAFCPDFNKLVEIVTLLEDEFGRHDDTARDINAGITEQVFNFKHVYLSMASIDRAASDDNGRLTAEIVIDFEYTRDLINTKFK